MNLAEWRAKLADAATDPPGLDALQQAAARAAIRAQQALASGGQRTLIRVIPTRSGARVLAQSQPAPGRPSPRPGRRPSPARTIEAALSAEAVQARARIEAEIKAQFE